MNRLKNSFYQTSMRTILVICLCIVMIFSTLVLVSEYFFFRDQAFKFIALQKEYHEYIKVLKKQIYAPCSHKNCKYEGITAPRQDEKITEFNEFMLVNRDYLYLRDGAIGFSKVQNLEKVVQPLYNDPYFDGNYTAAIRNKFVPKNPTTYHKQRSYHYPIDYSLSWPVKRTQFWLSSKFGPRNKKFHYGIDLAALKGTPVYAAMEGTVIEISYTPKGYGKSIVIDHKKCKTRYAHLDSMCIKKGQKVSRLQQIGSVGATGLVKGKNASHLHFEVIDLLGKRVNPLYILK